MKNHTLFYRFIVFWVTSASLGAYAQVGTTLSSANDIDKVVAEMTLEEKASIIVGGGNDGVAGSGAMMGSQHRFVAGAAGTTNAIPRLGITSVVMTDGPAGVHIDAHRKGESKTYYATGFPVATALASSWNTELVKEVGAAIGNETREYGCDVILSPAMNIQRNPLCGRNYEYYSEDPILSGMMATAMIQGIQSQGVGTSLKHFAVNSQETDRTNVDERLSQRALREIYLRGFEMAVKEGKPWTVMSSYNKINGVYAQESYELLHNILRDEWGYKGVVVTDWTGKRNTPAQVRGGSDLMMPGYQSQADEIVNAVKDGKLDIKFVDDAVKRILRMVVNSPRFRQHKYSDNPDLKEHADITRQSSTEGMVLLKNGTLKAGDLAKVLPLRNVHEVALFGVCSYDFLSGGLGSGCVHTPYVVDLVHGLANANIKTTPLMTKIYQKYIDFERIKFQADKDPNMWFLSQGQPKLPEIEISRRSIEAEVDSADAAIITIGRQAGEGIDREVEGDFNLTETEHCLLQDVSDVFHAKGKPVIVVINSGSIIETVTWRELADAILVAWQPGEEGGNSVVDILSGKVNPSGKLTATWPRSIYDNPSTKDFPKPMSLFDYKHFQEWNVPVEGRDYSCHNEDIYVGYRYYDTFNKDVAYPFGYGLSYTNFEYKMQGVRLIPVHLQGAGLVPVRNGFSEREIQINVTITNTGKYAGKEVAQVYVSAPKGSIEKPSHELKAFAKTRILQPGESQKLTMRIPVRDLASFDEANNQWLLEEGTYKISVGASSRDIRISSNIKLNRWTEKVGDYLKPQEPLNLLRQ